MAQASRDNNKVPTLLGTSNADGSTTLPVYADPSLHILSVENGGGGSDLSDAPVDRDENRVPALMAVSSADGVTPVPVYADSITNALLIDT